MTDAQRHGEHLLAAAAQRREAVLAGNGATALWAALTALDLPAESSIVLPDITAAETVHAVVLAGLRPQFVDVRLDSATPAPAEMAVAAAAGNAGAMVPTRLYGRCGRLPTPDPSCPQIIDATQCSVAPTELAGGLAVVTGFASGDHLDLTGGAAVLTDDPALAREIRTVLANLPPLRHELLQPAAPDLDARLAAALPGHNEARRRRRARGQLLREALAAIPSADVLDLGAADVAWRVAVRLPEHRDMVWRSLTSAGFAAERLFAPLHRLAGRADWEFPRATMLGDTMLSCDPGRLGDDPVTTVTRLAAIVASILDRPLRKQQHAGT